MCDLILAPAYLQCYMYKGPAALVFGQFHYNIQAKMGELQAEANRNRRHCYLKDMNL